MEIRLAKTAGFCFGVDRAVQLTRRLLDAGEKAATLGPLIHNPQVVAELAAKGACVAGSPADVPPGCKVVIRSHGVPQSVSPGGRKKKAPASPWRGTPPTRRCRGSSGIPGGSPLSLPIWTS